MPARQASKRAAILTSARELFAAEGVDRVSMDAVSAHAGVSKRTVYDYYGDKRRLLLGVIEDAGESAVASLRRVIEAHLVPGPRRAEDLRIRLPAFAVDLGASLFGSSGYQAAVKLIAENDSMLPELAAHPLRLAHEQILAERLSTLAGRRLLDIEDSLAAAAHFYALTTLRVLHEPPAPRVDLIAVSTIMADGAEVFLRAYAAG